MTDSNDTHIEPTDASETAFFDAKQARVIGSLMEKQLTVPDSYPLTPHSLMLACNQKSNRDPVMHMTEGECGQIAKNLEERNLVRIEYGERAHRIQHTMRSQLNLSKEQQAFLTVMLLRGPQTLNELKTRTQRSLGITDMDEIELIVETMIEHDELPLVICIPKGPGQREDRYMHLLCGPIDISAPVKNKPAPEFVPAVGDDALEAILARIEMLEKQVEKLEARINSQD